MKKLMVVFACAAMTLALVGCSSGSSDAQSSASTSAASSASSSAAEAQLANPWQIVPSLDSASRSLGFELVVPFDPIQVLVNKSEDIIEASSMSNGETVVRKGVLKNEEELESEVGANEDDVSGDFNYYPYEGTIGDITVKGISEDEINLATWTDGNYAYSIESSQPMTAGEVQEMADSIS